MATDEAVRQYVVFDAHQLFKREVNERINATRLAPVLWGLLEATRRLVQPEEDRIQPTDYCIESVPRVEFVRGDGEQPSLLPLLAQGVFSVVSPCAAAARRFGIAVLTSINRADGKGALQAFGANPRMAAAEFSIPIAPDATLFGTLEDARRLIGADQIPASLDGRNVNVVVIDAGIDKSMLPPGQFGGGWWPLPEQAGAPLPQEPGMTTGAAALHGRMVVNNILAFAPRARIFDVPLIRPPKIGDIDNFIGPAEETLRQIYWHIRFWRWLGFYTGPWVFMNAWTVYDRRSEYLPGAYTENLGNGSMWPHPFIKRIERMSHEKFDIVFAAGNCGRICPDGRCGPNDYGPGRSIWGANAHKDVLTVGAVRVDAAPLGYSSEGPGPKAKLEEFKPDLCAPSQFEGTHGEYPTNTGTSTSAAIAAGVIAALRSKPAWNQTAVSPDALKTILNNKATRPARAPWNPTTGNGILNAAAAIQALP